MKKLLLSLMLVLLLVTGCTTISSPNSEPEVKYKQIKIGDVSFEIKENSKIKNMNFKYSPSFQIGGYENQMNIYYGSIDNPMVAVRFMVYVNNNIETMLKDVAKTNTYTKETINEKEWYKVSLENGGEISNTVYLIGIGEDTYMVVFSSKENIEEFEKETMNLIEFE